MGRLSFDYPEGATPLDPDEIEGLLPDLSTQSELNEFEALNISEAMQWARRSTAVKKDLLQPRTLEEVHRRMFDKTWRWAGKLRKTEKSIGVETYRITTELKNLCEDVSVWIEYDSYGPDEIAARFHHRLVTIHPFPNGNGRHARLVTDLLCHNQKWPIFSWGSTDLGTVSDVRRRYISALKDADRHNIEPLIQFVRT